MPQQNAWVVERLGKYDRTLTPGLKFVVPFIERVAYKHSLKEVPLDVPSQVCITKDNTQLSVDGIIYFQVTDPRLASPDIQVHFLTFSTDKMGDRLHPFSGFTASSCQLRPESRGYVRIQNRDPHTYPLIQPNYLATDGDRKVAVDSLRLARRILRAPSMAKVVEAELADTRAKLEVLRPKWDRQRDVIAAMRSAKDLFI